MATMIPPGQEPTLTELFLQHLADGRRDGPGWWARYHSYQPGGAHRRNGPQPMSTRDVLVVVSIALGGLSVVGAVFLILAVAL